MFILKSTMFILKSLVFWLCFIVVSFVERGLTRKCCSPTMLHGCMVLLLNEQPACWNRSVFAIVHPPLTVDESHTLSRFDHSPQADFSASYVMHTAAAANTSSQHDPESAAVQ